MALRQFLGLVLLVTSNISHADTVLIIDSEPGDPIGNGQSLTFTPMEGSFIPRESNSNSVSLEFRNATHRWRLQFAAPQNEDLMPGPYLEATRLPFQSPTKPGLSISANGAGCNTLVGQFEVLEFELDQDGLLHRFAARFEQHCESNDPALFGEIRYNTIGPPFPPPPDLDSDGILDTVDNCPTASNPTQQDQDLDGLGDPCDPEFNETYVILDSEPGDYIGQGMYQTLLPADGTFYVTRTFDQGVNIQYFGNAGWVLNFAGPDEEPLAPGPYENAQRYPFKEPGAPGLEIYGDGRGCNVLTGRFDIIEVEYGPNEEVLRFAADFEQHCEGGEEALFGAVRFNASLPDLKVHKRALSNAAVPGGQAKFLVTVTNVGLAPASDVVVADQLPAGLQLLDNAILSKGSFDAGSGEWTVGNLLAGESATLQLNTLVSAELQPGTVVNTARVLALAQTDPVSDNDVAEAELRIALSIAVPGVRGFGQLALALMMMLFGLMAVRARRKGIG